MTKKVTSKAVMEIMIEGAKEVKKEVIPEKKKELAIKTMKKVEKQIKNEEIEAPAKKEKVKVEVINSPVIASAPKSVKDKLKIKKLSEKVKSDLPKTVIPETEPDRFANETIDYTIEETTMYAFNYFYLRKRFIDYCNVLIYPYLWYAAWFNRTFNRPRILRELNDNTQKSVNDNVNWQSKLIRSAFRSAKNKNWEIFKPEAKTDKPPIPETVPDSMYETPTDNLHFSDEKRNCKLPEIFESDK